MKKVTFIDHKGEKHYLDRKQFKKMMERLVKRAKIMHNMQVIENDLKEET